MGMCCRAMLKLGMERGHRGFEMWWKLWWMLG